jgi:hypothetical protein
LQQESYKNVIKSHEFRKQSKPKSTPPSPPPSPQERRFRPIQGASAQEHKKKENNIKGALHRYLHRCRGNPDCRVLALHQLKTH